MLLVLLYRGLRRRCPRCGGRDVFASYFTMRPACPDCGLDLEREEGYWLGAMIVNMAWTEAAFLAVLVGMLAATWPAVPWGWVLAVLVAMNVAVPTVLYPHSRSVWVALDLGLLQRMEWVNDEDDRDRRNAT